MTDHETSKQKAKLILINGFIGSGKTTIAKKYISDHSLAMSIEADTFVDNIGDWTNHREEARQLAFALTKAMIVAYLPSGHDVVLPYFVTDPEEAGVFESAARECGANFYEIVLYDEKPVAIQRLLARGKLGMKSSPPISEKDLPVIEKDFGDMEAALEKRPNSVKIPLLGRSPDMTYRQLLEIVAS